MPALNEDEVQQLKVWVRDSTPVSGMQRTESCLLKNGPQVFKTASLLHCGTSPDEISHVELRFQTSRRIAPGNFHVDRTWACADEEIAALRQFLDAELGDVGEYRLIRASGNAQRILDYVSGGDVPSGFLVAMARALAERVDLVSDLSEVEGVELVGRAVDLRKHQAAIEDLNRVVMAPGTSEGDLQAILQENWWMLGANYVGRVDRRRFTVLDEFDVPLLRADNVLHIVELKKANVPGLVKKHRNHFTVGDEVNDAVNQAANYLRSVDEQRAQILADFDLECRRAQATVVIGHPTHNGRNDVSDQELREAIRTYNSHLSRIDVITYEDVLTTARNAVSALARNVTNDAGDVTVTPEGGGEGRPPWGDMGEEPF